MPEQTQSNIRGWIVTFAALGINLASGTLYAWSVMGKALVTRAENPWTKTQAAIPFAVATATFSIMMIFAGRMQDKIGPRRIALLGGIVLGAGFIAASFATTPALMGLCFALVGLGIGLSYAATTPAAIKWFPPARKGLITGIVVSGVGLAAVYASPLAAIMLKHMDISQTLFILGIGSIVSICLLALIVNNPPAGYVPPSSAALVPAAKAKAAISGRNMDWPEMLSTPQFYLLWIIFVLGATPGLMIIANVAMIADQQAKWVAGFVPVMTLALFNASGRIVGGFVSDRIGRTQTIILAFVLQAVNMLVFSHYTTPAMLVFGTAFTGLCYGTIFTLMPAATADFYGVRNLGVNFGLLFTAFGVAGSLGSLLGGRVRDLLGSYFVAYMIMAGMLLVGAALASITRAPRIPAEPAVPAKEPASVA
ncbi:MAG: OFA family MFS transporter [Bacillota bacterium]